MCAATSIDPSNVNSLRRLSDDQAERAILSAMMSGQDRAFAIVDSLKPHDFYHGVNREIFEAIQTLVNGLETIDEITIADSLSLRGTLDKCGGVPALAALAEISFTANNTNAYVEIVKRHSVGRQLTQACQKAVHALMESEASSEVCGEIEREILAITQRRTMGHHVITKDALMHAFKYMEEARKHGGKIVGLPSGIKNYDLQTKGFRKKTLQVIAGRPGMGKTTFAMQCAMFAAMHQNVPVAIFTYEMDDCELMLRMLANEGNVDGERVLTGDIIDADHNRLTSAASRLQPAKFFFIAAHGMTVFDIVSKCRRLQAEEGLRMVVVDYIQAVAKRKGETHEREIAEITEHLKQLAGELDLPVIALSQLNRQSERSENKRPEMSHLLASGKIEADADVVTLMFRPDYYDQENKEGMVELIVAKNRGGKTGTVEAVWRGEKYRIDNVAPPAYHGVGFA